MAPALTSHYTACTSRCLVTALNNGYSSAVLPVDVPWQWILTMKILQLLCWRRYCPANISATAWTTLLLTGFRLFCRLTSLWALRAHSPKTPFSRSVLLSRHVHIIITQASHWSAACCSATCYKHLPYCCMTSPAGLLHDRCSAMPWANSSQYIWFTNCQETESLRTQTPAQILKKFFAIYKMWSFITMFTTTCHRI
jgi:hypothetical protein